MDRALGLWKKMRTKSLRLVERIEELSKKQDCFAGEGVRLYLASRIENLQGQRSAISIGRQSHIRGELLVFPHGGKIEIGDACYVGENARIWSAASIAIGNWVLISHGVNIHDNNSHSLSALARYNHFMQIISSGHPKQIADISSAPVVIKDEAWIGFNATILKGVTIGRGAVVGAASVVTKDVADYTIVAGNPAKAIGFSRP